MTIKELSFLTDENIDQRVVAFLRGKGFDVVDIIEEGLLARLTEKFWKKLGRNNGW